MGTNRKQPFGYKMELGKVVTEHTECKWVQHLFDSYRMGTTLQGLADEMNTTGVRYDADKPWNKNMVARILGDSRYLGQGEHPKIIGSDLFSAVTEKRQKKAPAVQKTEAQVALRRKCCSTVTPYIEQEVLHLLNCLAGHPERIFAPEPPKPACPRLEVLEKELEVLLAQLPVDEDAARDKMMELAAVMYEAIDSREYETYRMRRVFEKEQPRSELSKDLIVKNISAVMVSSNGIVKIKLKNEQILERGDYYA